MTRLNYIAHKILISKYRFIITIFIYLIIMLLNNSNIEVLCLEDKKITDDSKELYNNNKLIGTGLFIGSIILILVLQSMTGSGDNDTATSACVDMTLELLRQGTLLNNPEFLDDFTLTKEGRLYINDVNIDTHNIYLNANEVIRQIRLEDKALNSLNMITAQIKTIYALFDFPGSDISALTPENFEHFFPTHLEHFVKVSIVGGKHTIILETLQKVGLIDPNYIILFDQYIANGGQPEQFYNFLLTKIQPR